MKTLGFASLPPDITADQTDHAVERIRAFVGRTAVRAKIAEILVLERRLQADSKQSRDRLYKQFCTNDRQRQEVTQLAALLRSYKFNIGVCEALGTAKDLSSLHFLAYFDNLPAADLPAASELSNELNYVQREGISKKRRRAIKAIAELKQVLSFCVCSSSRSS